MIRPRPSVPGIDDPGAKAERPAAPPPSYVPVDDRSRRIQIGLAGLFGILLLIGLAGMIRDPQTVEKSGPGTAAVAEEGNEPLADPGTNAAVDPPMEPGTSAPVPVPPATAAAPAPSVSVIPDLEPETPADRQQAQQR